MKPIIEIPKKIWLLLLILLGGTLGNAQNNSYLVKANEAFEKCEYEKALKLYSAEYILTGENTSEMQGRSKKCQSLQQHARYLVSRGENSSACNVYESLLSLNPSDNEAKEFLKMNSAYFGNNASKYSSNNIEIVKMDDGKQLLCYVDPNLAEMTYKEAAGFCNRLNAGGETGWRLPTMDELMLYYYDFPSAKGHWIWVGYKGVLIDDKEPDYYERNTNMRYDPCINGETLQVHPYRVNSRGEYVSGNVIKHSFIPVKIK